MVLDKRWLAKLSQLCSPYYSYKYCSAVDGEFLLHGSLRDLVMIYDLVKINLR